MLPITATGAWRAAHPGAIIGLLEISGATTPAEAVDAFGVALLGDVPDAGLRPAVLSGVLEQDWPAGLEPIVAALLASPAFQWR